MAWIVTSQPIIRRNLRTVISNLDIGGIAFVPLRIFTEHASDACVVDVVLVTCRTTRYPQVWLRLFPPDRRLPELERLDNGLKTRIWRIAKPL